MRQWRQYLNIQTLDRETITSLVRSIYVSESIPAKAEICQTRFLRLGNFSAAKTRTTLYDAYFWQMITLCGIVIFK